MVKSAAKAFSLIPETVVSLTKAETATLFFWCDKKLKQIDDFSKIAAHPEVLAEYRDHVETIRRKLLSSIDFESSKAAAVLCDYDRVFALRKGSGPGADHAGSRPKNDNAEGGR